MWHKPVEELVQIISHNTVNNQAAKAYRNELNGPDGDEDKHLTNILKGRLSRNDIAGVEKRLGIALLDDYKDFLATTNGMDASWGGILQDPPLFPASKVRWITKEEEYFTDLTADILPDVFILIRDIYDNEKWPKVDTPLEIGSEDIDSVWLLPPVKVKELVAMYLNQRDRSADIKAFIENAIISWAGSVGGFEKLEWCVITWASGGAVDMRAYPSFKAFLVSKAEASAEDNGTKDPEQVCFSYSCH